MALCLPTQPPGVVGRAPVQQRREQTNWGLLTKSCLHVRSCRMPDETQIPRSTWRGNSPQRHLCPTKLYSAAETFKPGVVPRFTMCSCNTIRSLLSASKKTNLYWCERLTVKSRNTRFDTAYSRASWGDLCNKYTIRVSAYTTIPWVERCALWGMKPTLCFHTAEEAALEPCSGKERPEPFRTWSI